MTLRWQLTFWLAALLAAALIVILLNDILLPFVAAFVLAYFFDPVADRLQRLKLSRLAATLVVLGFFVLLILVAFVLLLPVVVNQLIGFIEKLPSSIERLHGLVLEHGAPLIE